MSNTNKDLDIDLGSDPEGDFDPFALDDDLEDDTPPEPPAEKPKAEKPAQKQVAASSANPIEAAVNAAETKEAEKSQQSLMEKPPVFEYAGASEAIEDSSQTFDELRIEKAKDFPELQDGKRASWTVEYGKISKIVADPKGTSIAKMKSDIETSKEFLDSLKKAKDKNPVCKIKPKVTAQSKGTMSAYKGVFTNMDDAIVSGKVISFVPARDGKVYEIRNTDIGRFTTPAGKCDSLDDVKAGFLRTLPLIPAEMMFKIISFFRYFMSLGSEQEALVNIYWDKCNPGFFIDVPKQIVSKASVDSEISNDLSDDRFIHYMDIHSHNSMKASFSSIDDRDERATRLYTVIGNLDKYLPDIKTRFSNGGTFHEIEPSEVFEHIETSFPIAWTENVSFRSLHGDDGSENLKAGATL